MNLAHVILQHSVPQTDQLYSYEIPPSLKGLTVGMRVLVPFGRGNKRVVALVLKISQGEAMEGIKPILKVFDGSPILERQQLLLGIKMREHFLTTFAQTFQTILPPMVLSKAVEVYEPLEGLDEERKNALFSGGGPIATASLEGEELLLFHQMEEEGLVKRSFYMEAPPKPRVQTKWVAVASEEPRTPLQEEVYQFAVDHGPLTAAELRRALEVSSSPVDGLIKKKALIPWEEELEKQEPPQLNGDQKMVLEGILESPRRLHLLHGVTGSGKTEIYLHLAQEFLAQGKSVIILVPEIGLTPQIEERFRLRFGEDIALIHSGVTAAQRAHSWSLMRQGKIKIAIGPRSAIFAPVKDLGLIVVDEEQEDSYDYQEGLRYDVHEVAELRGEIEGAKVLFGSATPSVSTYFRAQREMELHKLPHRANPNARPAGIQLVDMRMELVAGNTSIVSRDMAKELKATLERREQALLFLNRRGYSHFVSCRSCGHVITCENCDISMTYHMKDHRLHCHYCGATKERPKVCPQCGSSYLKEFGIGTEQVEEWCSIHLPEARVFRMDRDTMTQKDAFQRMYQRMQAGEIDILIGTQMVTKGFDFPNITFVGIIAADLSLYVSDFRAQEKTFQLLTQVAGRAGRGAKEGRVILQTYNPDNYSIGFAQKENYLGFYEMELEERRKYQYPPFMRLITLSVHSRDYEEGMRVARNWEKTLYTMRQKRHLEMEISPPIEMPRIKNEFITRIRIKCSHRDYESLRKDLQRVLRYYYQEFRENKTKLFIDLKQ
ncbi:MAG: primosomal protein N' [Tissierellia bacterium]|nr:primosomal protein N' [Tissierellia bacterium]